MKGEVTFYDSEEKIFQLKADIYEGGGGQPPDRITVTGEGFSIRSNDTMIKDGKVFWIAMDVSGIPQVGKVEVHIDELWRLEVSQQHTAQHIFSAFAEDLYGWASEGFTIFENESKIELMGADEDVTKYDELERKVNETILQQIPVRVYVGNRDEGLRKPTEYDHPRIVEIEGVDKCACGGTHVTNTGHIGGFAILKVERKNTRYVRVIFAAGLRLARIAKSYVSREQKLKDLLSGDVEERVNQLLEQKKELEGDKKNLVEFVSDFIARSSQLRWENVPLDMQSIKQIAATCNSEGKNVILINKEGYFAIGGPDAQTYFEQLKQLGASGGGKGVITGKIKTLGT